MHHPDQRRRPLRRGLTAPYFPYLSISGSKSSPMTNLCTARSGTSTSWDSAVTRWSEELVEVLRVERVLSEVVLG
jgi:hypothetical protein